MKYVLELCKINTVATSNILILILDKEYTLYLSPGPVGYVLCVGHDSPYICFAVGGLHKKNQSKITKKI